MTKQEVLMIRTVARYVGYVFAVAFFAAWVTFCLAVLWPTALEWLTR